MIRLHTNHGDITLELDSEKAPLTTQNFLDYVNSGHYDNTVFHRVIDNFMIQGGGFEPGMTSDVHSATAQFFINVKNNDFLDYKSPTAQGFGYCVFGRVVEGKDVVDKIKKVKTGPRSGHQDVPVENVILHKAEVIQ